MRQTEPKQAEIGSISHGTMRPQDLLPTFLDELDYLDRERAKKLMAEISETVTKLTDHDIGDNGWPKYEDNWWNDIGNDFVDELFDILNEYAPPWCYFGAHPGDGADYGFWISEGLEYEFDGLKVSDTSEIPNDYTGEVLHINDHGNCTLYNAKNGKLTEIWAVV